MFMNLLGKQLKLGFRDKSNIFWTLMFPVLLGTLFYIAFGSIYDTFLQEPVKTAVVFETDNPEVISNTKSFLEGLSLNDGSTKLLDISYLEYSEAEALLKDDEKVNGIIKVADTGRLSLDIYSNGVRSTIQQNVVTSYNQSLELIERTAKDHPENLVDVIAGLQKDTSHIAAKSLVGDNKDPFLTYFYSLLSMTALFASLSSLKIGNRSQANMSAVGARANVSPVRRMMFQATGFVSSYIVQTVVLEIALLYMMFVLKINFGGDKPLILATAALASLVGVSLGFFIGNIGSFRIEKKEGILVAVTLVGCSLSGLMYGDMKAIITEHCPIVNKLNPAAVISDAFYCLNMFGPGERYLQTVIFMLGISSVFIILGLVLGRKVSYDSV